MWRNWPKRSLLRPPPCPRLAPRLAIDKGLERLAKTFVDRRRDPQFPAHIGDGAGKPGQFDPLAGHQVMIHGGVGLGREAFGEGEALIDQIVGQGDAAGAGDGEGFLHGAAEQGPMIGVLADRPDGQPERAGDAAEG